LFVEELALQQLPDTQENKRFITYMQY